MSLDPDVVQKAAQGRIHHRYINLERSEVANARTLIKALGAEIERLTAENEMLRAVRDECESQYQEKVAEIGRLTDAILFARAEGFEWPADPFDHHQQPGDEQ